MGLTIVCEKRHGGEVVGRMIDHGENWCSDANGNSFLGYVSAFHIDGKVFASIVDRAEVDISFYVSNLREIRDNAALRNAGYRFVRAM